MGATCGHRENCQALQASEARRLLNIDGEDASDEDRGVFPDSGVRVRRIPRSLSGSPYIVADVGREIVDGHTDIGRPNLVCWINQLLDTMEVNVRPLISSADSQRGESSAMASSVAP
jgi:hypothetical protein